mgnify:CR=1 FL=1
MGVEADQEAEDQNQAYTSGLKEARVKGKEEKDALLEAVAQAGQGAGDFRDVVVVRPDVARLLESRDGGPDVVVDQRLEAAAFGGRGTRGAAALRLHGRLALCRRRGLGCARRSEWTGDLPRDVDVRVWTWDFAVADWRNDVAVGLSTNDNDEVTVSTATGSGNVQGWYYIEVFGKTYQDLNYYTLQATLNP